MLEAVIADFASIPGVAARTLVYHGRVVSVPASCETISTANEEDDFRRHAAEADYTLVIAPETAGVLRARCRMVEEAGGKLLGPSANAVEQISDKWWLGEELRSRGIAVPAAVEWPAPNVSPSFPAVWKPRRGAGAESTFVVQSFAELEACRLEALNDGWCGTRILQPYCPGKAASAGFLIGPAQRISLPACEQLLSMGRRIRYLGGLVPLEKNLADRAVRLAERAVDSLTGLLGYVGVDVVLGESKDGSDDWVIEVNPRLTTSYAGYRALTRANLAEAMLKVAEAGKPPVIDWNQGPVGFRADGTIADVRLEDLEDR
jgi:predicted ATP-grasp superfamily ATP-dependent carboligase